MSPYTALLVICFFTLATVGSDGQQRRNAINTLHTTISVNDINNIATTTSNNYTKKLFNYNHSNANANSLNTTIVLPIMDADEATSTSSTTPSSSSSSSSSSSYVASSILAEASSSFSSTTLKPVPVIVGASASGAVATEASVFRDKRGASLDPAEIARQNQITQQILSNYLERRLFPERSVSQKIPTIADILPKPTSKPATTKNPRQRARPRGFAASSSFRKGSARRKTYGQRKTPNTLQHALKSKNNRNQADEQPNEEDFQDEPEQENAEIETELEDISNNKTLNYEDEEEAEELQEEEPDVYDEPPPRYATTRHQQRHRQSHQQHSRRPSAYHQRYYDDDVEQDGQESLQSVESEQHDRYYKSKGDIFSRDPSENEIDSDCPNCVDETQYMNKWTMPLLKLGEKRYYLGIFFKANWFKATQYCRYHGMHLASISSQEENDRLEKHIKDFGLGHEHFWISGTDLADEGNFFWMATGRPITFTNWNAGEPNNFRYENGEEENCLELWNRDGKGLKWNDSPCSFETYFVCEVQP